VSTALGWTAFKNAKRMCPAFEDADKALAALKKTFGERCGAATVTTAEQLTVNDYFQD